MKVHPALEPLQRLRTAVPAACQQTLDLLIGTVTMPMDQPACATAVATLANCLLDYGKQIPYVRPEFQALLDDARIIADAVTERAEDIQGTPPSGQMDSRNATYPSWTLIISLCHEQQPLRTALGAEIALALLERGQLNTRYCTQLRRDAGKYGRPEPGEDRDINDLKDLKFGRGWLARYQKIDRQVRRRVELLDPNGPVRPDHANPKNRFDLLARLKWRFEYPDPKHRQGGLDDSHLPPAQYRRVASAVREKAEHGDCAAVVQAISMLNRLTPVLTLSLPLISAKAPLQILGLDIERGALVLDLRPLFPGRKAPSPSTKILFYVSDDILIIPLPLFLAEELRRRLSRFPNAQLLGDLVSWVKVDHRASLITDDECKLVSSLTRASKSTGAMAIMAGTDRLVAACMTWDFSFVGSARMYYARLTGRDIHAGCSALYADIGWGDPAMEESQLRAAGSLCTLTEDGAKQMFGQLARLSLESWPGRRANFDTLLDHHACYTRYSVALISFCLGLREVHAYRLLAHELMDGQVQITIHDKQGGDRLMAQPVHLNSLVREQVRQYIGHCQALSRRLHRLNAPQGLRFVEALDKALRGDGALFLVRSPRGGVRPAGSHNTWGGFPEAFRVPANVGRHFWQNVLREQGLGSRDIDRFMRHRVVSLESNTTSQMASPRQSFARLEQVQLQVLNTLGIGVVSGLRKV